MGLRAGTLTEPIIIQQQTTAKSEFGDEVKSWTNYISTRCSVKSYTGNRQTENMEIVNTYNITFTVRNYHSINETMRIIWKGKYYRIISILPDKYKQSTDIIGELINE